MPFAAVIIGAVLIVAAFNNTHGQLASELETDVPGFFKWGAAIALILGIGFIPGLEKPSRWLLVLVAVVIVVTQGKTIIQDVQSFATSSGQPSAPAPASTATGGSAGVTQLAGAAAGTILDPASIIADVLQGVATA